MEIIQPMVWNEISKFEQYTPVLNGRIPEFLELFFALKNTPLKLKNSKLDKSPILFGTPCTFNIDSELQPYSAVSFCTHRYSNILIKNHKQLD